MPLSIRNSTAEKLAREVSRISGESITRAIIIALEEKLERLQGSKSTPDLLEELMTIAERCSRLPDLDPRSAEEIMGYDNDGAL